MNDNETDSWPFKSGINPTIYDDQVSWPKISIVTPSYNQGEFIEKTILSVINQDYPNLEFIIIDGGSTDLTTKIIKKYDSHIDFWVSEKDRGQSHAINKGFEKASGKIFGWINSDDILLEKSLMHVAQEYHENPFDALVGKASKRTLEGDLLYESDIPPLTRESFLHWRDSEKGQMHFLQPACFFSSKAWHESGPLREDLEYCMDVDLWIKMASRFKFRGTNKELACAYAHENAKTTAEKERTAVEINLLITEHGGFDIAKRELFKMANDLNKYRTLINKINKNPVARLLKPFIKKSI